MPLEKFIMLVLLVYMIISAHYDIKNEDIYELIVHCTALICLVIVF